MKSHCQFTDCSLIQVNSSLVPIKICKTWKAIFVDCVRSKKHNLFSSINDSASQSVFMQQSKKHPFVKFKYELFLRKLPFKLNSFPLNIHIYCCSIFMPSFFKSKLNFLKKQSSHAMSNVDNHGVVIIHTDNQ